MLIRVRTNAGLWRVPDLTPSSTVADLLHSIALVRPSVEYTSPLCSDPACKSPLVANGDEDKTLGELGLQNGSMIYCGVVPETCAEAKPPAAAASSGSGGDDAPTSATAGGGGTMKRVIGKDGSIKLVPAEEADGTGGDDGRGFRKGQMALRDMKMQWTLAEFTAMDDQYVFKVSYVLLAVLGCEKFPSPFIAIGICCSPRTSLMIYIYINISKAKPSYVFPAFVRLPSDISGQAPGGVLGR